MPLRKTIRVLDGVGLIGLLVTRVASGPVSLSDRRFKSHVGTDLLNIFSGRCISCERRQFSLLASAETMQAPRAPLLSSDVA